MSNLCFNMTTLTTDKQLEPYKIIDINEISSLLLLISITFAILIGILMHGLIIKYIIKQPEPKRPVDSLLLRDQSVQALSFSVLGILTLAMLWKNQSIKKLFGTTGCLAIFIFQPVYMWQKAVGSLGLTLFRFIYLEKSELVQKFGIHRINRLIVGKEIFAMVFAVIFACFNALAGQADVPNAICEGIPIELSMTRRMMNQRKSFGHQVHLWILNMGWKSLTVIRIAFIFLETGLNFKLYLNYKKQTDKIKSSITAKSFNKRRRKSAINLGGHLICFLVNLALFVTAAVFIDTQHQLEGYHFYAIGFLFGAVSSIGTLMASPEMRREYLGGDDVLCPSRNNLATNQELELEEVPQDNRGSTCH